MLSVVEPNRGESDEDERDPLRGGRGGSGTGGGGAARGGGAPPCHKLRAVAPPPHARSAWPTACPEDIQIYTVHRSL